MRINRFLAASGLGSRRSCEELILGGSVTINGQVCQNLATDVSEEDFVKVGSRRILPEKHLYVLLHKPRGYLCTASDTHDRQTVFELLPGKWPRLFHVGRLDRESEGLLILTNDGDLGLHLTHPRYKIEKEYEVLLDRHFDAAKDSPRLLRGVNIEYGRAKAESVRMVSPNVLRIVLRQGLKRQIRLMLYKVGYEVKQLVRMRIGPLRLTGLRPGEWRLLTPAEVKALRNEDLGRSTVRPGKDIRPGRDVRPGKDIRPGKPPGKPQKIAKGAQSGAESRPGKVKVARVGKKDSSRGEGDGRAGSGDSRPRGTRRRPGAPSRPDRPAGQTKRTSSSGRRSASSAPRVARRP